MLKAWFHSKQQWICLPTDASIVQQIGPITALKYLQPWFDFQMKNGRGDPEQQQAQPAVCNNLGSLDLYIAAHSC